MVLKKNVICPHCNEKLAITISEENGSKRSPLFTIACLHNNGSRVLIVTLDRDYFIRKIKCLEIQNCTK